MNNPIEVFFLQGKKFPLSDILTAYSDLISVFLKHGCVTSTDVAGVCSQSDSGKLDNDIRAFVALMIETLCIPLDQNEYDDSYVVNEDMMQRDNFLSHLGQIMHNHCGGQELQNVQDLQNEIEDTLYSTTTTNATMTFQNHDNTNSFSPPIPDHQYAEQVEIAQQPNYPVDIEKSEPIVRFLAQVRKMGMDVLFPQSAHDKVNKLFFTPINTLIYMHFVCIDRCLLVS